MDNLPTRKKNNPITGVAIAVIKKPANKNAAARVPHVMPDGFTGIFASTTNVEAIDNPIPIKKVMRAMTPEGSRTRPLIFSIENTIWKIGAINKRKNAIMPY